MPQGHYLAKCASQIQILVYRIPPQLFRRCIDLNILYPYNLVACHSGQIQIFLYNIEGSGTLSTDANYLAAAVKQRLAKDTQGKTIIQLTRITDVQWGTHCQARSQGGCRGCTYTPLWN